MSPSDLELKPLLREADKWGLHDDACKSFEAKFDDFEEQSRLCDCWKMYVKLALKESDQK